MVKVYSLNTLGVLTIDRYIFIKKPLHYPLIMTPRKTWMLLLSALLGALGFAFLSASVIKVSLKFTKNILPSYVILAADLVCQWTDLFMGLSVSWLVPYNDISNCVYIISYCDCGLFNYVAKI